MNKKSRYSMIYEHLKNNDGYGDSWPMSNYMKLQVVGCLFDRIDDLLISNGYEPSAIGFERYMKEVQGDPDDY